MAKVSLGPAYTPVKVKFPAEHQGQQFQAMHPSNVTNSLHGYYESSREEDFITKHPYGLDQQTHQ